MEEGRRGEEENRREERTLYDGVSYCQCNFEDCLLVQLMCQHVCLLHKAVGVQHRTDETLPILVLPLFPETVSMGVFVCECYGGGPHNFVMHIIHQTYEVATGGFCTGGVGEILVLETSSFSFSLASSLSYAAFCCSRASREESH